MGKTRACAALKKIRNAAKLKNLEFLAENVNVKAQVIFAARRKHITSFSTFPSIHLDKDSRRETAAQIFQAARKCTTPSQRSKTLSDGQES